MRRTKIIAATILSIVLCVGLIIYGVYANLNQNLNVANTIGFEPSRDVFVSLECNVEGAIETDLEETYNKKKNDPETEYSQYLTFEDYFAAKYPQYEDYDAYKKQNGYTHKVEFNDTPQERSRHFQTINEWKVKEPLSFKGYNDSIVYTITIYNYSDLAIEVWIDYNVDDVNFSHTPSNTENSKLTIDAYDRNDPDGPKSATVTMTSIIVNQSGNKLYERNDFTVRMENIPLTNS